MIFEWNGLEIVIPAKAGIQLWGVLCTPKSGFRLKAGMTKHSVLSDTFIFLFNAQ
jgi:hypothetical protein